jgi:peptidyl-prolyl cis-trans isomerase D
VNKITPGNAITQPALIGRMQNELGQAVSDDYAREFLAAIRQELGAKRNESAIQALKTRMVSSGG